MAQPAGKFPAVQEAFDFIKDKLNTGEWHQGECLPSVRDLAKMAGVSKPTMIKAIALLKNQKFVSVSKRCRIRVGCSDVAGTEVREKLLQWQEKRKLLEKDILSGIFGYRGNLPPLKELQTRYGVCFGTMKKMTRAMMNDGMLKPKGKGYALPEIPARLFRDRIVFITMAGHFSQKSALNQEHNRIVNMFENECKRAGFQFEMIELDFYDPGAGLFVVSNLTDPDSNIGFVLDVWWYDTQVRRSYLDVLLSLLAFKKPIAAIDELGNFELPLNFASNPLVQVFTIETKRAGERMARYLFGLGHKSVAYISSIHQAGWSQGRYEGVAAQFSRVGLASGVHLVADTFDMPLEHTLSVSGLTDDEVRRIISVGRSPSQARNLEKEWLQFRSTRLNRSTGDTQTDLVLRNGYALLAALVRQGLENDVLETMITAALGTLGTRIFEISLKPLFEKALKLHDVTAWICTNDGSALEALSFLRKRNIAVPGELSVVGFDNAPVVALDERLTTFDFNATGFISQILSFIVRPLRPRGPYRHSIIEVEGIILERGTAARPKA